MKRIEIKPNGKLPRPNKRKYLVFDEANAEPIYSDNLTIDIAAYRVNYDAVCSIEHFLKNKKAAYK